MIYKLISKTIVNTLKSHMPSIINDSQSAFVEKGLLLVFSSLLLRPLAL